MYKFKCQNNSEMDVKTVIGIVVCLAIICIALIACCFIRRRRRQNEIKSPAVQTHTRSDDVVLDIVDGDIEVDGGPRSKRKPTLDLHGMSRQQALQEVPQFIQNAKTRYHNENGSRHVNIITGRGLHSENRFPVLKVETKKFLERVGLKFFSNSKGGQLVVDLKS